MTTSVLLYVLMCVRVCRCVHVRVCVGGVGRGIDPMTASLLFGAYKCACAWVCVLRGALTR